MKEGWSIVFRIFVSLEMITQVLTHLVRSSGLEERTEDGGACVGPVKSTCGHELVAYRGGETRDAERLREDAAVHLGN